MQKKQKNNAFYYKYFEKKNIFYKITENKNKIISLITQKMMVYIISTQLLLLRMTLSLSLSLSLSLVETCTRDMYCCTVTRGRTFCVFAFPPITKMYVSIIFSHSISNFADIGGGFHRRFGCFGQRNIISRSISFFRKQKSILFVYSERELFLARGSHATSECKIRKRDHQCIEVNIPR